VGKGFATLAIRDQHLILSNTPISTRFSVSTDLHLQMMFGRRIDSGLARLIRMLADSQASFNLFKLHGKFLEILSSDVATTGRGGRQPEATSREQSLTSSVSLLSSLCGGSSQRGSRHDSCSFLISTKT
jgi:hypothetical protein